MTRGRRSERALAAAIPVARMRGEVMFLEQRPGTCFDLLTSGPTGTSAVRVERALRIHGTLAEIAAGRAEILARISAAALTPGFSRELWLWSPWGTMRYFRIEGTAITELDRLGTVRAPLVKGSLAGTMRPRWRKRRKKSGVALSLPASGPEQSPGGAEVPQSSGTPMPAPASAVGGTREPAPVRYLRRRALEKSVAGKSPAAVPARGPDPGTGGSTP